MEFNNYKAFQFERRGKVLEVTFNRPDKLNAVDEQMHAELATLFTDISNDPDSQVIVLTGASCFFCRRRYRLDAKNDRYAKFI